MKFSEKLASLMREKGETAYRVSKEVLCSQSTISNWLKGKTEPTNAMKKLLAAHFGITVDELLSKDDEANQKNNKKGR